VLSAVINRDYLTPPKDATSFYISVPSMYRPVNFTIPEYISTNFDEAEKAYRGAKSF